MRHALVVGAQGVGKSTLIQRVLRELDRPVFGFETKRETALADETGDCPIYIYEAGKPHVRTEENLVGRSGNGRFAVFPEAFERYAAKLRAPAPKNAVIELDELGFLESAAEGFCATVLELLDGTVPVVAAVKNKDTAFLGAVRRHENCRCFTITPQNRDALYTEVLAFLKTQLT